MGCGFHRVKFVCLLVCLFVSGLFLVTGEFANYLTKWRITAISFVQFIIFGRFGKCSIRMIWKHFTYQILFPSQAKNHSYIWWYCFTNQRYGHVVCCFCHTQRIKLGPTQSLKMNCCHHFLCLRWTLFFHKKCLSFWKRIPTSKLIFRSFSCFC